MSKSRSVLVIDDDSDVVSWLVEALGDEGFEAEGIADPEVALRRIRDRRFDVVISDVEMPSIRGTDLIARIHAVRDTQLVVMMTAFGSVDLAMDSIRLGASDFVTKPFRVESLVHVIERAMRERTMRREIVRLRSARNDASSGSVVADSPPMVRAVDLARRAAASNSSVLLTGESGVGKGLFARMIHDTSARRSGPFVAINCAALPAALVEAELFGVRRGAYTDAREDRPGLFRRAEGGTLFLDELGEMAIEVQPKLLHVLETGKVRAVGDGSDVDVDVRIVAATNRPLEDSLRERRFRADLYHRLNVIRIDLPPLRERLEDLPRLVDQLLVRVAKRSGRPVVGLTADAMRWIYRQPWPGNVRELSNVIERAVALTENDVLERDDLVGPTPPSPNTGPIGLMSDELISLDELERRYIRYVLERTGGNKTDAAKILGVDRRTLYRKSLESGD